MAGRPAAPIHNMLNFRLGIRMHGAASRPSGDCGSRVSAQLAVLSFEAEFQVARRSLERGEHRLEFRPMTVLIGAVMSAMGVLGAGALALLDRWSTARMGSAVA